VLLHQAVNQDVTDRHTDRCPGHG